MKVIRYSVYTRQNSPPHSHQVQCAHEAKLTTSLLSGTVCTRGKIYHLTPIRYSVHTRQNSPPHSYHTPLLSHPTPIRYSVYTRQNSPPHSYQVQCAHEAKLTTSLLSGTVCTRGKTHHPTPIRYSVHTRQNSPPHSYHTPLLSGIVCTRDKTHHPIPIGYSVHTRQNSPPHFYHTPLLSGTVCTRGKTHHPHSHWVQCAHEAKLTTPLLSGTVCTRGKTHHPTPPPLCNATHVAPRNESPTKFWTAISVSWNGKVGVRTFKLVDLTWLGQATCLQ